MTELENSCEAIRSRHMTRHIPHVSGRRTSCTSQARAAGAIVGSIDQLMSITTAFGPVVGIFDNCDNQSKLFRTYANLRHRRQIGVISHNRDGNISFGASCRIR